MKTRGSQAFGIGASALTMLAIGAAIAACGGGSTGGLGNGAGTGGAAGSSSGTGGSSAGGSSSSGADCPGTTSPQNHETCPASVPTAADCTKVKQRPVEECGVLIAAGGTTTPPDIVRTTSTKEYMGTGAPDGSCYAKEKWPAAPGTPQMVTVTGYARNFANGCDAAGSKIEIYKVKRTGGADDGALGDLVGSAINIANTACNGDDCMMVNVMSKCDQGNPRIWRKYTYANVPTETELLIKTSSADGMQGFAQLYDYNIYIPNSEVQAGVWAPPPTGRHDVRVVNIGDYSLIPTTAIGRVLTAGHGAIAGEVHDCGDVRVSGAYVDVSAPRTDVGYFTDVEDAPLPDPGRTKDGTSTLGLYAAYDMAPGPVRVSATGSIGGQLTNLGYFDVRVFPDAVTAVTFRGMRPFQVANAAGK